MERSQDVYSNRLVASQPGADPFGLLTGDTSPLESGLTATRRTPASMPLGQTEPICGESQRHQPNPRGNASREERAAHASRSDLDTWSARIPITVATSNDRRDGGSHAVARRICRDRLDVAVTGPRGGGLIWRPAITVARGALPATMLRLSNQPWLVRNCDPYSVIAVDELRLNRRCRTDLSDR
jgi:hypothetical protein